MTTTARRTALATAIAGALLAGCAGSDCTVTPDLRSAPSSCTLAPNTNVTVSVRWCSCSVSTVCRVTDAGSGIFQLEPVVNSCDASCESNPASCGFDTVPCTFQTPSSGTGSHSLYIIGGQDFITVPLILSGSEDTCS